MYLCAYIKVRMYVRTCVYACTCMCVYDILRARLNKEERTDRCGIGIPFLFGGRALFADSLSRHTHTNARLLGQTFRQVHVADHVGGDEKQ